MIELLYLFAFLWLFWAVYVLVMGIYRAHLAGRLRGLARVLGLPLVVFGYLMDVFANLTVATLVFLEPPREALVTTRLIRLQRTWGWRGRLANWVCNNLLDPFDPTGNHC